MKKLNESTMTEARLYRSWLIFLRVAINYQSPDVYHITCMRLDTQWKTAYHSLVRVVYTT